MKANWILLAIVFGILSGLAQAQQSTQTDREPKPIIYGIVIDASKSIGSQFKEVIEAAKTIVNNNKPGDETFLVRFVDSGHIETLQDFRSDKTALLGALDKLFTDLGQSAVTDALYLGGRERGIEDLSSGHYQIEPYRGDAKAVIAVTFEILAKLYKGAS